MIIFEDDKNSPCSLLLREFLKDNVRFSSGALCIPDLVSRISARPICIMLDVSIDNQDTVSTYLQLKAMYKTQSGIYVCAIPCIEYFIILMLYQLKCLVKTKDTDKFFKLLTGQQVHYMAKSFERFCKSIIKSQLPSCKRNAISGKDVQSGNFYFNSCLCDEHKSKCTESITVEHKSVTLLRLLPITPWTLVETDTVSTIENYIQKHPDKISDDIKFIYNLLLNNQLAGASTLNFDLK